MKNNIRNRKVSMMKKLFINTNLGVKPAERFMELVLVNIDPNTGELIPDSEKNPTKWGDWQHHGRVTDF